MKLSDAPLKKLTRQWFSSSTQLYDNDEFLKNEQKDLMLLF